MGCLRLLGRSDRPWRSLDASVASLYPIANLVLGVAEKRDNMYSILSMLSSFQVCTLMLLGGSVQKSTKDLSPLRDTPFFYTHARLGRRSEKASPARPLSDETFALQHAMTAYAAASFEFSQLELTSSHRISVSRSHVCVFPSCKPVISRRRLCFGWVRRVGSSQVRSRRACVKTN